MLSQEENDLITETGPGTPGGDFMRRYWHPVALSEELKQELAKSLLHEEFGTVSSCWIRGLLLL